MGALRKVPRTVLRSKKAEKKLKRGENSTLLGGAQKCSDPRWLQTSEAQRSKGSPKDSIAQKTVQRASVNWGNALWLRKGKKKI